MKRSGFLSRKGRESSQQGDDKSARPSRANGGWQAARRPSNDPQAAQTTRNSPAISHKKGGKLQLGRASRTHLVEQDPLKPYREKIQQSQHNLRERLLRLCHTPARHPEIMAKLRQYHAQLRDSEIEGVDIFANDMLGSKDEVLSTLNEVLNYCLPVCDLFSNQQLTQILSSNNLTKESDCLAPLNSVIRQIKTSNILERKSGDDSNEQIKRIHNTLHALADYYSQALSALCAGSPIDRRALLEPKPYIALGGIGLGNRVDQPMFFEFDLQDSIDLPDSDKAMPLLDYLVSLRPITIKVSEEPDIQGTTVSYQGLKFQAIKLGDRSKMAESASSFTAAYSPELALSSGWIKLFHIPLWSLDDYTGKECRRRYRDFEAGPITNLGSHNYIEQLVHVSEVKDKQPLDAITLSPKIFTEEKPIFRILAWLVEQFQREQHAYLTFCSATFATNDSLTDSVHWNKLCQQFYPEVLPQLLASAKSLAEDFQARDQGLSNQESIERLRELSAILFLYCRLMVMGKKIGKPNANYPILSHAPITIDDCLPTITGKKLRYAQLKQEKNSVLDLQSAIHAFFNGYNPFDKKGPAVNDSLIQAFDFSNYRLIEKLQILEVIGTYFSFIHELKSLTDSKDSLLLQAAKHALPGAVKLLLRLGAKVEANDANGRDVLHQLLLRPINDEKHLARILATLDVLMSCASFNPFAVDHQGYMAIMHLISHAKIFQMKFIERIIRKLQMLPVFDINHPSEKGTLLDLVMSFTKPPKSALFVLLVRLGAGRHMNVKNALEYTQHYAKAPGMDEAVRRLCRPDFNSEYYYARAFDVMSVDPNEYKGQTVALESMDGTYVHLHPDVVTQVFDEAGRVKPVIVEGGGRVALIEYKGFRLRVTENPQVHANQEIASLVRSRLASYDITPFSDVYLLRDLEGTIFPIQITVVTPGDSYKEYATNNTRNKVDSRAATEVLITDNILVPEDFNPNSATIEKPSGRIFIFQDNKYLMGSRGSERSIMYCQSKILDQPLDQVAVARFCMRDLRSEMQYFADWIQQRDQQCRSVLTDKMVGKIGEERFQGKQKRKKRNDKAKNGKSGGPLLGYFYGHEMLVDLYLRMQFIQEILRSQPTMTLRTYITMVVPQSETVLSACDDPSNTTPGAVFNALWGTDRLGTTDEPMRLTEGNQLSQLPPDITHNPQSRKKYTVSHALKRLKEEFTTQNIVGSARKKILQGDMSGLNTCPLSYRNEIIYNFDFEVFGNNSRESQLAFLKALIEDPFALTQMKLKNFNTQDDKELRSMFIKALKDIFAKSPNLVRLTLINCSGVDKELVRFIANNCKKLQHMDLTDCNELNKFTLKGVEQPLVLVELMCLRLTNTRISNLALEAPKLSRLYINNCVSLSRIVLIAKNVGGCNLRILDIEGAASKLTSSTYIDSFVRDINEILGHSFQLEVFKHNHTRLNTRAFAGFAIENNRFKKAVLKSLISRREYQGGDSLQTLNLHGMNFDDLNLRQLARYVEEERCIPDTRHPIRIEALDASGCVKVSPSGLLELASAALPTLQKIVFHSGYADRETYWVETGTVEDITISPSAELIILYKDGKCLVADRRAIAIDNKKYFTDLTLANSGLGESEDASIIKKIDKSFPADLDADYGPISTLPDGRILIPRTIRADVKLDSKYREKLTTLFMYDPISRLVEELITLPFKTILQIEVISKQLLCISYFGEENRLTVEVYVINSLRVALHKARVFEPGEIDNMAFTPDGRLLTSSKSALSIWDLDQISPVVEFQVNKPINTTGKTKHFVVFDNGNLYWSFIRNDNTNDLLVLSVNLKTHQVDAVNELSGEFSVLDGNQSLTPVETFEAMIGCKKLLNSSVDPLAEDPNSASLPARLQLKYRELISTATCSNDDVATAKQVIQVNGIVSGPLQERFSSIRDTFPAYITFKVGGRIAVHAIKHPTEFKLDFQRNFPVTASVTRSNHGENSLTITCQNFSDKEEEGAWQCFANFLKQLSPSSTVESNGNVITLTNCPVDIKVLNRFVCALTGKKNAYQYTSIPGRSPVPKDILATEPTELPDETHREHMFNSAQNGKVTLFN